MIQSCFCVQAEAVADFTTKVCPLFRQAHGATYSGSRESNKCAIIKVVV